jgi:C1A family cysteine protease
MNYLKSLFLVLLLASTASAESLVSVTNLNRNLQKENATWFAKENWMTKLSKGELQKMMGAKGVSNSDVEFDIQQEATTSALPAKLDWRNKNGRNYISPMVNQANCGSCVAFATVGVMESQINIANNLPGMNVRLSPQHLFSCGGGLCDDGWWPLGAIEFLQKTGVTDESCMPYVSGATGKDESCGNKCADSAKRTFKVSDYGTPTKFFSNLKTIKEALQHGPLIATLKIYSDFIGYAGGVYAKSKDAEYLGGHAISIVGYDDSKQAFIIRNSWGEEWGEKGFGYVAYDNKASLGRQTFWVDVAPGYGSVAVSYPRDYSYVSGTSQFTANAASSKADSIQFTVFDSAKKSVWTGSCQGKSCGTSFDSTQFAEGRYEIQATAHNTHGDKITTSTKQFFYIVNQEPELKLSFAGVSGTDLTKPVMDRIDMAIKARSSSVPMNSIEFYFKTPDGKIHVKTADIVLNEMTMGWRTNLWPNGKYEIWMVGRVKTPTMNVTTETPHYKVTVKNEYIP